MTLRFIGIDPDTDGKNCPRFWFDDEKKEFVIQGWTADEALNEQVRATGPLPGHEAVVRIPARMMQIMREACDVAEQLSGVVR